MTSHADDARRAMEPAAGRQTTIASELTRLWEGIRAVREGTMTAAELTTISKAAGKTLSKIRAQMATAHRSRRVR